MNLCLNFKLKDMKGLFLRNPIFGKTSEPDGTPKHGTKTR